jgi:hypothetical protein
MVYVETPTFQGDIMEFLLVTVVPASSRGLFVDVLSTDAKPELAIV